MKTTLIAVLIFMSFHLFAQNINERKIKFPDIPGYKTLICDFHQHTVFSDGSVWPSIRVQEAIKDGLDAISLTDHLEYQPFRKDIPHPDRNRPYQIAKEAAKNKNLIVINGAEITRSMPPGHSNALFLKDVNKLLIDDSVKVFKQAKEQDAFVFWNHPHWTNQTPDGIAKLTETHKYLLKKGLINGIEVVNTNTYSDEALQIALDYNLTIMGSTDIHSLIDWQYDVCHGGHRPVTIVFAKEKSEASIKDGLNNRRTVVWFKNTLIGRAEYLVPLIEQSLIISKVTYKPKTTVLAVTIENISDVDYIIENQSKYTLHNMGDVFTIKANESIQLDIKTIDKLNKVELKFMVLNAITAPKTHPEIIIPVKVN